MTSIHDLANPGVQKLTPYAPGKPLDELEREYGITDALEAAIETLGNFLIDHQILFASKG